MEELNNEKLNDFPSRTEKVVINQLRVDETYQRPVSKAKVNKIVKISILSA